MGTLISPEMILYILIFIGLGIVVYLTIKWIKKHNEDKRNSELAGSAVSPDYLPPPANAAKGKRTFTPAKILSEWAFEIKNAIHLFKKDDVYTILSVMKRVKTKLDLAILNSMLRELEINVMEIFAKGLTNSENKKFVEWQKNIPEYYKP